MVVGTNWKWPPAKRIELFRRRWNDFLKYYRLSWDDARAPATTINPPGQASDPDREAATGLLLFAAGGTELIYLALQLSHGWAEGTNVKPHVHWTKTTSAGGDVLWRCEYDIAGPGDTFAGSWTLLADQTSTVSGTPDNDTAWEHLISTFGELDMSAFSGDTSVQLLFKISRIGGDAADTYGADARLIEFDVHFQRDSYGSNEEFDKT